jgi:hypothetical protein
MPAELPHEDILSLHFKDLLWDTLSHVLVILQNAVKAFAIATRRNKLFLDLMQKVRNH